MLQGFVWRKLKQQGTRVGRRSGWENRGKVILQQTGWDGLDRIHLLQGGEKMASFCEHGDENLVSITCR